VEPVRILDWKVKVLRNKAIDLVKVQWTYYGPKDTTWEHEETMREEYLQILKKIECAFVYKCARLHFGQLVFQEPHLKDSWPTCAGALEGEWYSLRDCGVEKGVHFLGLCRLRGTRDLWLDLLQEL
jgi:hypothetical protein